MDFIFESIQSTVNLLFIVVILGTLGISWIFANRLRKRHNADFPWNKTLAIVGLEILTMVAFNIFFEIFQAHWLLISIGAAIVIFIILSRKKRKYV